MNKKIVMSFVVIAIAGGLLWYSGMWNRLWQKPAGVFKSDAMLPVSVEVR